MDADLQDPPELLPRMIETLQDGYDVVSAQRTSRAGDSLFKRLTAQAFYWLMRCGMNQRVVAEVGEGMSWPYE